MLTVTIFRTNLQTAIYKRILQLPEESLSDQSSTFPRLNSFITSNSLDQYAFFHQRDIIGTLTIFLNTK